MSERTSILHARVVAGCGGGPDKTIMRSHGYMDRDRYDMASAYLYPADDHGIEKLRSSAQQHGMPFYAIPERGAIDRRAFRMMLDLCRRLHVDIWHSHDYKTDLMGLLIRRYHPMRLITTVHGFTGETWQTRFYAKLNQLAFLGYDHVAAVSPKLVRFCAERGVHPDRLSYLPNGIELVDAGRLPESSATASALGRTPGGPSIAVVSRFSPEKGVDRSIRLFARVLQEKPTATLHLIGDGPERGRLEQLAQTLGISPRVRWWGWQTKTRPYLEMADALLLTSHTEGLPNAVLEAMAAGVPVAATRVGAVPEVLDGGGCGVLLDEDKTRWPSQIAPLLVRGIERQAMIAAATTRLHERYDFAKRMQRVFAIYDRLTDRPRAAIKQFAVAA